MKMKFLKLIIRKSNLGYFNQNQQSKNNLIPSQENKDKHDKHAKDANGKPSLMDKLNPKTDADRDGKAGIMD